MSLTFKLADAGMRDEVAELWRLCFGDPQAYIDFYLDNGFVPEQVLVGFKAERAVAMLTMMPFDAVTPTGIRAGRYVFAVATHPDYQKQGISTALLEEAHQRMREDGVDFSVLVPASEGLFAFYGARGYKTTFYLDRPVIGAEDIQAGDDLSLTPTRLEDLKAVRDACFSDSALFCGWSSDTLRLLGQECAYQGGEVLAFELGERPGYAVCYPYEDSLFIKECVPAAAYRDILPALHRRYGKSRYHLRLPAGADTGMPFAMCHWYTEAIDLTLGQAPYISLVLD